MVAFEQGFYAGKHQHNLDAKKRLTVPSKWRYAGDEHAEYLAYPDPSGCITVYPPRMVEELKAKLSAIKSSDIKGQRAIMQFLGEADQFTIDKNGRINLSEHLYVAAGIEKAVLLVGTVNKFHLWNPERYGTYVAPQEGEGDLTDTLSELGI